MTRFDLHQLELFAAVMECSTLTRAAEKMHLTPGAVSRQLSDLAFQLHTALFAKSGRLLVPTPDAVRLMKRVEPLMQHVRAIEQEFESQALNDTRPFRFACGATTLIHALGNPLRRLRSQFPNASIQVTVGNMRTIIDAFFAAINVRPNIVAVAEDVEVLRRLVESGFGYSILPQMGLQRKPLYFRPYRVPGHKIVRTQALAVARSERPRPLTESIAAFLKNELADCQPSSKVIRMSPARKITFREQFGEQPRCVFS